MSRCKECSTRRRAPPPCRPEPNPPKLFLPFIRNLLETPLLCTDKVAIRGVLSNRNSALPTIASHASKRRDRVRPFRRARSRRPALGQGARVHRVHWRYPVNNPAEPGCGIPSPIGRAPTSHPNSGLDSTESRNRRRCVPPLAATR
jgi:hypothetical protein